MCNGTWNLTEKDPSQRLQPFLSQEVSSFSMVGVRGCGGESLRKFLSSYTFIYPKGWCRKLTRDLGAMHTGRFHPLVHTWKLDHWFGSVAFVWWRSLLNVSTKNKIMCLSMATFKWDIARSHEVYYEEEDRRRKNCLCGFSGQGLMQFGSNWVYSQNVLTDRHDCRAVRSEMGHK